MTLPGKWNETRGHTHHISMISIAWSREGDRTRFIRARLLAIEVKRKMNERS